MLVGQQVLIEDASGTATLSTSSEDVVYYLLRQRPEMEDFTEDNTSLPTLDIEQQVSVIGRIVGVGLFVNSEDMKRSPLSEQPIDKLKV